MKPWSLAVSFRKQYHILHLLTPLPAPCAPSNTLVGTVRGADYGSDPYFIPECDTLHPFFQWRLLLYWLTIPVPFMILLMIHTMYHTRNPCPISRFASSFFQVVVLQVFHPRISFDPHQMAVTNSNPHANGLDQRFHPTPTSAEWEKE